MIPISLVGYTTDSHSGAASGTISVALNALTGGSGSAPQNRDIIIVAVNYNSTVDRTFAAISGYTKVEDLYSNGTTYDANLAIYWKLATGGETSVAVPQSGSINDAVTIEVSVWRGCDAVTPFDVANQTATGTGTTRGDPPSITPVTDGAFVIAVSGGGCSNGTISSNYTVQAGYTMIGTTRIASNGTSVIGVSYKAWTSGAENPAAFTGASNNAADSWCAVTLALRPGMEDSGMLAMFL